MGEKLKRAMDNKNVTQAELAEAVGVTQAFMSYMVNGLKKPSVDVLKRAAEYLHVSMEDLI